MSANDQEFTRSFYWFDYETFGIDKRRDRPVQFGGLRTDENLGKTGSDDLFYCVPAEDFLPDPESCLVTGITPMACMDEGLPEAEFAKKIFDRLMVPGTIALGYNNIKFDDEVTRFMFWRNLLDPYQRERWDGRARMDLYHVIRAVYALAPNMINWPTKEDGSVSMRLEHLTVANGLKHEHAHDALSDTYATWLVAKLIREKSPNFWNYAVSLSDPSNVGQLFTHGDPLLYVSPFVGVDKRCLQVIQPLKQTKKNEWLCWDMAEDPRRILEISDKEINEYMSMTSAERKEKGVKPIPFVRVRMNQYPFVVKVANRYFTEEIQELLGLPKAKLIEHMEFLKQADLSCVDSLNVSLEQAVSNAYPKDENEDIETALYSTPFLSFADKDRLNKLREMDASEIPEQLQKTFFDNERLYDLVVRYLARNYPEYLPEDMSKAWYKYRFEHLIKGVNGSRTFEQFFNKLDELGIDHPDSEVLAELRDYGENLMGDYEC